MKFDPKKFKNKKAVVLGAGKSGIGCAKLLHKKGFDVIISEKNRDCPYFRGGSRGKLRFESNRNKIVTVPILGHTKEALTCDFAVKSPGIPTNAPVIKKLKKAKVPVFSELEIALSFCPKVKIFAVTGTNGKTTTTALLGDILKKQYGKNKVFVAGNIGVPLSAIAEKVKTNNIIALEVSSYQLEDSNFFAPHICAVLNITPDHSDHHGSITAYIKAKEKIFARQTKKDFCVLNANDKISLDFAKKTKSRKLFFGARNNKSDAFMQNKNIIFGWKNKTFEIVPPNLPGEHNLKNAMCAGLMALAGGASVKNIAMAFKNFKGIAHRLETIATIDGIKFINDSKATNVASTLTALKALETEGKKIWLIMGGSGKGSSYKVLANYLKKSVKYILTVGLASKQIENQLKGICRFFSAVTIKKASDFCFENARSGDICLLSPSCASFDQFKNFEHRGNHFKKIVREFSKAR